MIFFKSSMLVCGVVPPDVIVDVSVVLVVVLLNELSVLPYTTLKYFFLLLVVQHHCLKDFIMFFVPF